MNRINRATLDDDATNALIESREVLGVRLDAVDVKTAADVKRRAVERLRVVDQGRLDRMNDTQVSDYWQGAIDAERARQDSLAADVSAATSAYREDEPSGFDGEERIDADAAYERMVERNLNKWKTTSPGDAARAATIARVRDRVFPSTTSRADADRFEDISKESIEQAARAADAAETARIERSRNAWRKGATK